MQPELAGRRLLVVDDHAYARQVIGSMLRGFGFRADEVESGEKALSAIQHADAVSDPYHAVFIDWRMPGLDGIQTVRRLAAMPLQSQRPRPLMIAANGREEIVREGKRHGFETTLHKPVSPSVLFDATMRVLASEPGRMADKGAPRSVTGPGWSLPHARLLLVEDNEINREVATHLLQQAGIMPDAAENGAIALELLAGQDYDLVLMDMQMPVMDGFEATRHIRANPRLASLPVVAMTANALPEDRNRCLAAGMDDHIAKPISPATFFTTLHRWLTGAPTRTGAKRPGRPTLKLKREQRFRTGCRCWLLRACSMSMAPSPVSAGGSTPSASCWDGCFPATRTRRSRSAHCCRAASAPRPRASRMRWRAWRAISAPAGWRVPLRRSNAR
ncbi:response regulator [Cupriavidus basilensis]